jgi:hypothetical protein
MNPTHITFDVPRRAIIVLAALSCLLPTSAAAQAPASDSLPPLGSRVRIRAQLALDSIVTGRLEARRGDTLVVRNERTLEVSSILARDVDRLEVYRRAKVAETAGFVAGTVGAVAGTVTYTRWCRDSRDACRDDRERSDSTHPRYDGSPSMLTVMVVGGTAIGALTGYFLAPPEWDVVGTPVQLNVVPTSRGLVLGLSLGSRAHSRMARPRR